MSRLDEIKARAEQVHWTSTSIEQAMARMASSAADVPWLLAVVESGQRMIEALTDELMSKAAEAERLTAERDALAAQVARVEEVLDHWRTVDEGNAAYAERIGERSRFADGLASRADMLRAALADPEADTSDTQPTDQEVSDE